MSFNRFQDDINVEEASGSQANSWNYSWGHAKLCQAQVVLLPSLIWPSPWSLSQRSLLVLRTDMQPWMWMSFYRAAEWAPVSLSHQQTLTATYSPWPNFIRMERRFYGPPFLSFAGYSSASFGPGMKRRFQASLPLLVLEARLFLREGLNNLISFPIRFFGLPVFQDCSHKYLHFYLL